MIFFCTLTLTCAPANVPTLWKYPHFGISVGSVMYPTCTDILEIQMQPYLAIVLYETICKRMRPQTWLKQSTDATHVSRKMFFLTISLLLTNLSINPLQGHLPDRHGDCYCFVVSLLDNINIKKDSSMACFNNCDFFIFKRMFHFLADLLPII